jgi:hypothetical protein
MEKSIKMEPDLSEEQRQEITGACVQCVADMQDTKSLKEKVMKKDIQIEPQLSEEQLQDITGGCDGCTILDNLTASQNLKAAENLRLSRMASTMELPSLVKEYKQNYRFHTEIAKNAQVTKSTLHPPEGQVSDNPKKAS